MPNSLTVSMVMITMLIMMMATITGNDDDDRKNKKIKHPSIYIPNPSIQAHSLFLDQATSSMAFALPLLKGNIRQRELIRVLHFFLRVISLAIGPGKITLITLRT